MIEKTSKRLRLCILLLCCNLALIWGNSLMPGEISGAISGWVKDIVFAVLGIVEDDADTGHGLLRKLAHFTEFCCLGLCLSWLTRMLRTKPAELIWLPLLGGFLAACADETIQRFVPDRGPSIRDVGIDTAGVALGIVLICIVLTVRNRKSLKRKQADEKTDCSHFGVGGTDKSDSLQG